MSGEMSYSSFERGCVDGETEKRCEKILVAIATYNEIDNVPRLTERLLSLLPDADVLIVDDNSPDGTGAWAQKAGERDSRVKALVRQNERGLGSAVICALKYAIEHDYDAVVNMDADFSHPVEDAPRLIARLNQKNAEVDVVIGSRYVPGGATPDWPLKRRLMSRCVNTFARITLGLKTRDNSGAFRCYRVSVLRKLNFDGFVSTGYSFFEETLYRLRLVGARFAEIPIVFIDRRMGVSKINRKEAIKAVAIMLRLGVKRIFSKTSR